MNQLSILLIEDDPDDIELMHEALKTGDIVYSLEVVSEGDKVLPYLGLCKKFPNVIILDLNLPKLHGREVLSILKKSEFFQDIPVIILTTASSQKEKEDCIKAGADQFLTKPATIEGFNQMIEVIRNIASGSVLRD